MSRLIRELVDDLQETRGVCLTIPKEIRDVLNSEACSGENYIVEMIYVLLLLSRRAAMFTLQFTISLLQEL